MATTVRVAEDGPDEEEEEEEGWYSVWIEGGDLSVCAASAMERLRSVFGDSTSGSWESHITVVGVPHKAAPLRRSLDALRLACRSIPPFSCLLTHPSSGFDFYQSVFMLVDPSPQVMHVHSHVHSIFEQQVPAYLKKTDYMPHMSLFYGDLTPENKEKAKELVEAEFGHLLCNKEFVVSKLCLYSTPVQDRSFKSWRKIAEFPLEGNKSTD